MKPEDAEEFTQALGQVVAGSYRQIVLAKNLGVPKALGLTVEQWVHTRLGGYVRLSIDERREVVKELTNDGMSQREVAEVLGVAQKTVDRDLRLESNDSENAELKPKTESNDSESLKRPETEEEKKAAEKAKEKFEREESRRRAQELNTEWICGLSVFDPGKKSPENKAKEMLENFNRKAANIATDLSPERYRKIAKVIEAIAEGLTK